MNNRTISSNRPGLRPGVTLIELTAIIAVLLAVMASLYVGARAWKRGSDRAKCITQMRQVQVAVRSYANLMGFRPGEDLSRLSPPRSLQAEVIGAGKFLESRPSCPSKGTYAFTGDEIPHLGTLYMTCSLSERESHAPGNAANW